MRALQGVIPALGVRGMALAAGEVLGRKVVEYVPGARQRVARWVRRSAAKQPAVALDQLMAALQALGVTPGRHAVVHSSWDHLRALGEKPSRVVAALRALLGSQGTLLMPSHPLVRKSNGLPLYDANKTPSAVGLLTECLRLTPGATRSPVPEAPVCAIGRDASEYASDFRATSDGTPYGRGSPWHRLAERGGLAVFLGIGVVRANTLQHVAFDMLGDQNPIDDYYCQTTWRVVRGAQEEPWTIRRHRPTLERYLATAAFDSLLHHSGLLSFRVEGGIFLGVLDARRFLDWHLQLARTTGMPYFAFPGHHHLLLRQHP